jgi:hypothetical protein
METVKSQVFNFSSAETSSASGRNYPTNEELAKRFENKRRQSKRKPTKKKKGEPSQPCSKWSSSSSSTSKKTKKTSIRALLKQKAESSLHRLPSGKSSQDRKDKTSSKAFISTRDHSSQHKVSKHLDREERKDSKNKEEKEILQPKFNRNFIVSDTTPSSSVKKIIVVKEWDGRCNSYLMNLNVSVPAKV